MTKETPEYEWNPDLKSNEDDDEDVDYVQETLSLKSMIAGKNAVKGQRNIVEVSTITFGNLKTVSTLLLGSVTVGLNDVVSTALWATTTILIYLIVSFTVFIFINYPFSVSY